MSESLFVDETLRVRTGLDAEAEVRVRNDAGHLEAGRGICRVPIDRWRQAQVYERRTWMERNAHASEDRNEHHREGFDGYRSMAGRRFASAIEIGCGPFTNLRVIGRFVRIEDATLLDPLIGEYRRHRHCAYRTSVLEVGRTALHETLEGSGVRRAVRRVIRRVRPTWLYSGPRVREMLAVPVEEMPERGQFDLVVMINVIEHCYDVSKVFDRVRRLVKPGGVLVFHDKLYRHEKVSLDATSHFEAGHPLRVDESVTRADFLAGFRPMFERVTVEHDGVPGVDLSENVIYFLGEKP